MSETLYLIVVLMYVCPVMSEVGHVFHMFNGIFVSLFVKFACNFFPFMLGLFPQKLWGGGGEETSPTGDQASMYKITDYQRTGHGKKAETDILQGFRVLTTCSGVHKGLG